MMKIEILQIKLNYKMWVYLKKEKLFTCVRLKRNIFFSIFCLFISFFFLPLCLIKNITTFFCT